MKVAQRTRTQISQRWERMGMAMGFPVPLSFGRSCNKGIEDELHQRSPGQFITSVPTGTPTGLPMDSQEDSQEVLRRVEVPRSLLQHHSEGYLQR